MDLSVETAAKSVVLLYVPAQGTDKSVEGTGFLIQLPGALYLVTAGHLARQLGPSATVTFAGTGGLAESQTLRGLSEVGASWSHHPNADVAVIELRGSAAAAALAQRALQLPHLGRALEAPSRDRPLTTIGFPLGLGGLALGPDHRVSPISRDSRAASGLLTLLRADTKQPAIFFILDMPTIGGFSGAPVFMLPSAFSSGGGLLFSDQSGYCVGLVHGTLSDDTGGKLAMIVPVAYIVEALETAFKARKP